MSNFIDGLMSGSSLFSSSKKPDLPALSSFVVRASPRDDNTIHIHPEGQPSAATPLYTVHRSTKTKPSLVFYYGHSLPNNPIIGDVTFSSWSSKSQMTLRGQPLELKKDDLSECFYVKGATPQKLKWKKGDFSNKWVLTDAAKVTLAQMKKAENGDGKKLDIFVPCDGFLIEAIILSGLGARLKGKKDTESAVEALDIVSSLAGA